MDQVRPLLTVIAPALNEEEVLPDFHRQLLQTLACLESSLDFEILYVDDGSSDRTLSLLRHWSTTEERVRYLSLSRNFGHQAAFTAGLEHASGEVVVMLDSDLQHPPALIPLMLEHWRHGIDVVRAVRVPDPTARAGQRSRLFARLFCWLSEIPLKDGTSDYCLLSRRAVDSLCQLQETHRFLRGLVGWLGYPSAEIPFTPAPRPAGRTKFSPLKLTRYALDALLSFTRVPLRLALGVGLLFLVIGLIVLGAATVQSLFASGNAPLLSQLMLGSIYLVGGTTLCCLGALGEYVGRVYEQVKGRPLYLVKETETSHRTPRYAFSLPASEQTR